MEELNYYELLGLKPGATDAQIEQAFRREADTYNPSLNPGHEDRFQAILDAYSVLKNPETRAEYDSQLGTPGLRIAFRSRRSSPPPTPEPPKTLTQLMDFDWDALDEPSPEQRRREASDFKQEVAFKVIMVLAFLGLLSLLWLFLK